MNEKSAIDALIDDGTKPYAYVWCEKDRGSCSNYGHMYMMIFLAGSSTYNRPSGVIKLSSQIGTDFGHKDQFTSLYAQKIGFDQRYGDGRLDELEIAVKMLKKINKHTDKMYAECGSTGKFAEMCQRSLIGSGVKHLIASPTCYANGGNMRDNDLIRVGPDSMVRLSEYENTLVADFSAKAA